MKRTDLDKETSGMCMYSRFLKIEMESEASAKLAMTNGEAAERTFHESARSGSGLLVGYTG